MSTDRDLEIQRSLVAVETTLTQVTETLKDIKVLGDRVQKLEIYMGILKGIVLTLTFLGTLGIIKVYPILMSGGIIK